MKSRTAAFETMKDGLLLRDAADELHGKTDDGIERLLFRSGSRCQIVILACAVDSQRFRRPDNTSLSDGDPLVVKLRLMP